MSETRKIGQILVADIVGYSPLAGASEGSLRIRRALSRSAFARTVMRITPMKPTVCLGIVFGSLETEKYRSANHSRPSHRSHAVDSEASSEMKRRRRRWWTRPS
jgi:hypothetical protein